ncbi:polysaccharide deacetylase family protein [Pinibacter soli]|uniref:Polysaccharide deacetylase family protein n=1 Tax=Pinibacter soli TaxID=3044211 RepID=A0ABT6R9E1_9BACT|nr:polysaccharide deacetylase family protein [Pinibacter soli]MDI3319096.1 polysaccharide deacetylase family protein [Pinibacter soli]
MNIKIYCLLLFLLFGYWVNAQDTLWHHKKCAVVLTYDDAIDEDIVNVAPALDSLGLRGTFYLSNHAGNVDRRIADWRVIADKGHELGNHTYYHPCIGNRPGREFVKADNDLNNYTVQQIDREIHMMNSLLKAVDGKVSRTFAYPCGDIKISDSFYLDPIKKEFTGARSVRPEMMHIQDVKLYDIGCYGINGESGEQLISLVQKAMASHTLIVFLFHGVGGGHSLNVSLQAHSQLLHFLKQHEKEIWTAPMTEVADYIQRYQSSSK